jgi:cytochrome c oxidase subunit II
MFFPASSFLQSALAPVANQAQSILSLFSVFVVVSAIVYVLVIVAMLMSLFRPKETPEGAPLAEDPKLRTKQMLVIGSTVITVIILLGLIVTDASTDRKLFHRSDSKPITIEITGHQWWWEVRYDDPHPANVFTTANEIHVPVGKEVLFLLKSTDVIHSFWAPNFHGKKDLIPGHPATTFFVADHAGVFRGQCAEYCGHQHAHMRFVIVSEPQDHFYAWLSNQRKPSVQPATQTQRWGQHLFMSGPCIMCHKISGTSAAGLVGPDLTHIGSQKMIGAGTMINSKDHLAQWIWNAPAVKPGILMPPNPMTKDDLNALSEYLESLK